MDIYKLSRNWFDFAFENPSKISPNHAALYFFCIEHCNRLGWKKEFGLPTLMAKEAIGIRSYNTYIKTLYDLVDFGFIILVERSKNQHSSNIVALSEIDKALNKALDKAIIKHTTKQRQSTSESTCSINIQYTNNTNLQNTILPKVIDVEINNLINFDNLPDLLPYKNAFFDWVQYLNENKKTVKGVYQCTKILSEIQRISNNNPIEAQFIIDNLISNGWTTLQDNRKKDEAKQPEKPKQKKMFLCEDTGEHRHRLTEQEYERDKEKEKLTLIEVYYV